MVLGAPGIYRETPSSSSASGTDEVKRVDA
jgi:hypothetical protein